MARVEPLSSSAAYRSSTYWLEDKDGDAGPPLAQFQRRSDPFVGPGRRHPDVNDREIRTELRDRLDERGRRIDRRDRLDAGDG